MMDLEEHDDVIADDIQNEEISDEIINNEVLNEDQDELEEKKESMADVVEKAVNPKTPDEQDIDKEPEQKSEDKDKPPVDKKPKELTDDDLMKVPEGLKEETEFRMKTLITRMGEKDNTISEKDGTIEQQNQMLDGFQKIIKSTGANSQEFNELIQFSADSRGDERSKRRALEFLNSQRNALALELGETNEKIDVLSEHPDLRQAVQDMEISEQYAMEVARSRNQQKITDKKAGHDQKINFEKQQNRESLENYQSRVKKGAGAIDSLIKKWENDDIDWSLKEDSIRQEAERIATTMEPEQWEYAMKLAYKASAFQKPAAKRDNPLRPRGGGQGKKEAASMLDAVTSAVSE